MVTPSRTFPSSRRSVRTRIAPAAAMRSISCGDFLMITARLRGAAWRSWRGCGRAPRSGCGCRRSGAAGPAPRSTRPAAPSARGRRSRRLRDGRLAVVVALDELRAVLVADLVVLGRVGVDVVDVAGLHAHAPAGEAADDLLVGRLDDSTAVSWRSRRPMASSSASAWPTLRGKPSSRKPSCAASLSDAFEDHADDDLVGHEVAVVHVLLGLLAELGPVLDRLAQDVAGGDVGAGRSPPAGARPGCPCPRRAGREG